jgi:hypothetical protein
MNGRNTMVIGLTEIDSVTRSSPNSTRRNQTDAADPAVPVRWRRPPGGEAPKALRGGATYSPSPIWM